MQEARLFLMSLFFSLRNVCGVVCVCVYVCVCAWFVWCVVGVYVMRVCLFRQMHAMGLECFWI